VNSLVLGLGTVAATSIVGFAVAFLLCGATSSAGASSAISR